MTRRLVGWGYGLLEVMRRLVANRLRVKLRHGNGGYSLLIVSADVIFDTDLKTDLCYKGKPTVSERALEMRLR